MRDIEKLKKMREIAIRQKEKIIKGEELPKGALSFADLDLEIIKIDLELGEENGDTTKRGED